MLQGSGEATSLGTPYGFFHRELPGFAVGFPTVVDVSVDANRSQLLASYLVEGKFIDKFSVGE